MNELEKKAWEYAEETVEFPQGLPEADAISEEERQVVKESVATDFIEGAMHTADLFLHWIEDMDKEEIILNKWLTYSASDYDLQETNPVEKD